MRPSVEGFILMALCLVGLPRSVFAADTRIDTDTIWSGEQTLDGKVLVARGTLTIKPGTRITFRRGSEINVRSGATLAAKGTEASPIDFISGEKAGIVLTDGGTIVLERCRLANLAGEWSNRPTFLWATCGQGGVVLRNCTITDCGGAWITTGNGPFQMICCDLRRRDGLYAGDGGLVMLGGKNQILLADNTIRGMGAADNTCSDCLLRNNTFDLRSGTAPVWLNHLIKTKPRNLVIRNKVFLRTGRMYDEVGIPDCIAYTDYNLWAGTITTAPSAGAEFTSRRFVRITFTGKKEGDDGFGAHDVFVAAVGGKSFDAKAFVEDPASPTRAPPEARGPLLAGHRVLGQPFCPC